MMSFVRIKHNFLEITKLFLQNSLIYVGSDFKIYQIIFNK